MTAKYFTASLFAAILMVSCKEEQKQPQVIQQETQEPVEKTTYISYEPAEKSITKEGEVVFEKDTMAVFTEYTDNIAYDQQIQSPTGVDGIMKYRDMVVHLVSKHSGDTITVRRDLMTAKVAEIDNEPEKFILMKPAFDVDTQAGNVKMLLHMCLPDTDLCYYYEVRVDGKQLYIAQIQMIETENDPWVTIPEDATNKTSHQSD